MNFQPPGSNNPTTNIPINSNSVVLTPPPSLPAGNLQSIRSLPPNTLNINVNLKIASPKPTNHEKVQAMQHRFGSSDSAGETAFNNPVPGLTPDQRKNADNFLCPEPLP